MIPHPAKIARQRINSKTFFIVFTFKGFVDDGSIVAWILDCQ
jgi:hypothetical protein